MDVRRSMLKSKGSDDMGTWETILDYTVSEISSLRLAPQYGSFSGGKATVYAR